MALPTNVSHRCHTASSHVGWAKEPLGSFLGRVREPVGRLRQTAVPNDDLITVMTEIEALDAFFLSLDKKDDEGELQTNLPPLMPSPLVEPLVVPPVPSPSTAGHVNDWRSFLNDSEFLSEPSDTLNPRNLVQSPSIKPGFNSDYLRHPNNVRYLDGRVQEYVNQHHEYDVMKLDEESAVQTRQHYNE